MAVLVAGFLYPFVRGFSEAPDSGVFLNGAALLNGGAVPSRDFVEPQGPGSFLWLALFFRLFGASFETARGVLLATGVGLGLLAFHLSRRLGATGLMAVVFVTALSVPVLPINSPHYDSNLFALGALALFLTGWERPEMAWLIPAAATLCGFTTWMIQQKGCYAAAALVLALVVAKRWRAGALFGGVYLICALLPFGYFAFVHALPDVWFANFVWPMKSYSELNAAPYGFPAWQNFWQLLHGDWLADMLYSLPFLLVAALPLLLPVAAVWTKWRCALPCWLFAYALWLAELHRLDMGHLRNGVILMAILFFSLCESAGSRLWRRAGLVVVLCTAAAGIGSFVLSWHNNLRIQTRRGVIYAQANEPLISFLESHTKAGDEVFVYPYAPVYYFAEKLKNPTRFSYLQYHFHTGGQFQEAVNDLERKKVRYVIVDKALAGQEMTKMFPAYRHPAKDKLILEPYLEAHYGMVDEFGRFQVLKRVR